MINHIGSIVGILILVVLGVGMLIIVVDEGLGTLRRTPRRRARRAHQEVHEALSEAAIEMHRTADEHRRADPWGF